MISYMHVLQYAFSRPWALQPEKLAAVQAFLMLKAVGGQVDPDELRALAEARAEREERHAIDAGPGGSRGGPSAVAVIPLQGVLTQRGGMDAQTSEPLTSTAKFAQAVRTAVAEPSVRAVVLNVDSPGGEVFGTPEAADVVAELVAAGTKPIVAVANSLAASAAYWIASQAEELVVTPGGLVGSIGIYTMHQDLSAAAEQKGVRVTYVSAGKYKVEGNPFEPLGEEARAALETRVQDYYGQFLQAVARGRGTTPATVRDGYGQGRVLTAKRALAANLVDRVDTLEGTIERLATGSYRKPHKDVRGEDPTTEIVADGETTPAESSAPDPRVMAGIDVRRRRLWLSVPAGD